MYKLYIFRLLLIWSIFIKIASGGECREFVFKEVADVNHDKYLLFRFVPVDRGIYYMRGRPIGTGFGVWKEFIELHDFSLYVDSGRGFENIQRRSLWNGMVRHYIFYSESNEVVSTVGISCSELVDGLSDYYNKEWPGGEVDIKCYLKVAATKGPRIYSDSKSEDVQWLASDAILLRISNNGRKVSVVGYQNRSVELEEENGSKPMIPVAPVEITPTPLGEHAKGSDCGREERVKP